MPRLSLASAFVLVVIAVLAVGPAVAIEEPDRLWLVAEHAFADKLYPLAARTLDRFVKSHPSDPRVGPALLMLGRARLAIGENEPAADAFRRAQKMSPPPGQPLEARFWEAEALVRSKKYAEARTAYDEVVRTNAAGPFAPDALYGLGWTDLEMKRPEPAAKAFGDFLQAWPEHRLAPSATFQLARALIDQKKYKDAIPLLAAFAKKYPGHNLVDESQYLLGWTKIRAGDPKGGVADLKAFVEAYPTSELVPDAKKLITDTAARTGDKAELQDTYTALMNESPPTPKGLAEAVDIATRLGRPKDQDAAWKKLTTEFPDDPLTTQLSFDLAKSAFKRKDFAQAVNFAQAATKADDDSLKAEAWLLAGESNIKLQRFVAAAKAFSAVGAMDTVDSERRYRALAGLGLAREEQKELKAALTAYESVASKSPDPALRDWARARASAVKERLASPAPAPATKPAQKPKGRS